MVRDQRTADRFLERAAELRAIAEQMNHSEPRDGLLRAAEVYESMARFRREWDGVTAPGPDKSAARIRATKLS